LRAKKEIQQKYSDETLISRYKLDNNAEWIGVLFERYTHLVFGVCMKYLRNEDESKDGVMDIFERLLSDLKEHEISNFKSWLFTYTRNHCLMKIRKKSLDTVPAENYLNILNDDIFKEVKEKEKTENNIEKLENAINKLPDEQQMCIKLFYLEDKSYKEICDITGFNDKNVKSYIQNGKRRLKITLNDQLDV